MNPKISLRFLRNNKNFYFIIFLPLKFSNVLLLFKIKIHVIKSNKFFYSEIGPVGSTNREFTFLHNYIIKYIYIKIINCWLSNIIFLMPQIVPYFFLNQIVSSFIILFSLVYILSVYFLPLFTLQQVIRFYITKLTKNN